MRDFYSSTLADLEGVCHARGVPVVHAKTLYQRAYKDFDSEPWNDASLPRLLRDELATAFSLKLPRIAQESRSRYDGTVKFLVELHDGALVEAVLMPEKKRITLCISSQVGCAQACTFCYTGRMGLKRNLTAGEIVGQVQLARAWIRDHPEWTAERPHPATATVNNIVFMGMGEPLDNLAAVQATLSILGEPSGMNFALRKVSVSTAGHLDGLRGLLQTHPDVSLALSLHATNDRERSQLMPINRRWPIAALLDFLRDFYVHHPQERTLLVQYTVIRGVNDSARHADELIELLQGLPLKLNLIPLNEVEPSRFQGPDPQALEEFRQRVHNSGIRVMVRYSKGQDIEAACGQLVVKQETGMQRSQVL